MQNLETQTNLNSFQRKSKVTKDKEVIVVQD